MASGVRMHSEDAVVAVDGSEMESGIAATVEHGVVPPPLLGPKPPPLEEPPTVAGPPLPPGPPRVSVTDR